jgi:Rad52/22 family double-strand break repair protein
MSTQYPEIFAALAAPFDSGEVKVRSISGRQIHYITARTVANRLDNVLGPEVWWDEYQPSENSVLCKLTIRLPDGTTLTKCDAGGYAGMADQGDDDKSGYSDAFKRAAVKFGVGRYLYRDGVPEFAAAAFGGEVYPRPPDTAPPEPGGGGSRPRDDIPRSGKALFAWSKDQEQRHEVGLIKYLNGWAKLQEFPGRMVDWDADQVSRAYQEACRKLETLGLRPEDVAGGDAAPARTPDPIRTSAPPLPREHGHGHDGPPRSGKALFAWALAQEKRLGFPKGKIVKFIEAYGKQQGFPDRLVDYSREQVTDAYERTVRKLHEVAGTPGGREPGSDDHLEEAIAN